THEYCPRQEGDSRSPCPALNALANHGYLPRDGRKIDPDTLEKALIDAFQISHTFAYLLAHGGKFMLGQKGDTFSLEDLARHNIVEHDASLFHADAGSRDEYAPNHPDQVMVRTVLKESSDGSTMSPDNFVAARVKRDSCYEGGPKLDLVHHEIAIGEMGLVLTIFG
ncbi:Chloroperoxidase, partial [Abortiporus biennis]